MKTKPRGASRLRDVLRAVNVFGAWKMNITACGMVRTIFREELIVKTLVSVRRRVGEGS